MINFWSIMHKKEWKNIKKWIKSNNIPHYKKIAKNGKVRLVDITFKNDGDAVFYKFSSSNTTQRGKND